MRGPSKTPPKYRKHRASGQAIVTLSGQDFYLGLHATKAIQRECERLISVWLANGREIPVAKDETITVVRLSAAYRPWKLLNLYPNRLG